MSEKHSYSKTMPSVSKAGTGYNMNIAIYAIVILIQYTDKAGLRCLTWQALDVGMIDKFASGLQLDAIHRENFDHRDIATRQMAGEVE